jgi:hypothetical protein
MFQVERHVSPAALQQVEEWFRWCRAGNRLCALDTNHFGSEICEQHGCKRSGPDASYFDDAITAERSGHDVLLRLDARVW